jgi:molecular chaperone DnaK
MVNIKMLKEKTVGAIPEKIYVDVVRSDGAWSSGKKQIGEKASIVEVVLNECQSNSFDVNVYDEAGNKLECQPNQFSILQGLGGLDGMQVLPYHIGIAKYFHAEGKDLFEPVKGLEKSKKVPATGVRNGLKTRSAIRPGIESDIIRIPIYQGDHNAEGTNPVLNNLITEVIISGETLPKLLPEGSDVNITIKVDRSQIMQFTAEFPTIEHTEELEIEIRPTAPLEIEDLKNELTKAKSTAKKIGNSDIEKSIEVLEENFENKKGSQPGRMEVLDGLRKELLNLERAEKITEWPKVEEELKEAFYKLEDLIEKIKRNADDGNMDISQIESHLEEYRKKVEYIVKEKSTKDAKELTREIGQFDFELRNAVTGNAMDVQFLRHINETFNSYHWKDTNKAKQLVNQGLQMAANGNTSGIRNILIQVIGLMPDNEKPTNTLR